MTFGLFICRGDTETFAFATSYIVILSYSLLRRDGTVASLAQVDHPASTMWRRQAYRISSGAHGGNFIMALISVINILVSSRVRGQKSAIFKAISALFAICSIVKIGRTKIQDHVAELMISKDHNETPRDPSSLKQVDNWWLGARFQGFEEYVQEHKDPAIKWKELNPQTTRPITSEPPEFSWVYANRHMKDIAAVTFATMESTEGIAIPSR